MTTNSHQAPFVGLVITCAGRVFAPPPIFPSIDDPVFLPDFATLAPDQAQELRYAKGRGQ